MNIRLHFPVFLIMVFSSFASADSVTSAFKSPLQSSPLGVKKKYQTDVMLFNGDGTWGTEVSSLETLLSNHGVTYQEVSSSDLDSMSLDDLTQFGVMIFPGGEGDTEANSVSSDTHARLRQAVQEKGVGYVGFCAGAFIAVAPAPDPGQDVSYGFGIVPGPILDYYYLENQGTDIAMTLENFPNGIKKDLLWYGGPVTPNTPGGVIAKYPDGSPAITEIWSGKGLVVLSGVHPTATQDTLDSLGMESTDGTHLELAWQLVHAALAQQPLPAFQ